MALHPQMRERFQTENLDPTFLRAVIDEGIDQYEAGRRDFASWSKYFIDEFGEHTRPYLDVAWRRIPAVARKAQAERQLGLFRPVEESNREEEQHQDAAQAAAASESATGTPAAGGAAAGPTAAGTAGGGREQPGGEAGGHAPARTPGSAGSPDLVTGAGAEAGFQKKILTVNEEHAPPADEVPRSQEDLAMPESLDIVARMARIRMGRIDVANAQKLNEALRNLGPQASRREIIEVYLKRSEEQAQEQGRVLAAAEATVEKGASRAAVERAEAEVLPPAGSGADLRLSSGEPATEETVWEKEISSWEAAAKSRNAALRLLPETTPIAEVLDSAIDNESIFKRAYMRRLAKADPRYEVWVEGETRPHAYFPTAEETVEDADEYADELRDEGYTADVRYNEGKTLGGLGVGGRGWFARKKFLEIGDILERFENPLDAIGRRSVRFKKEHDPDLARRAAVIRGVLNQIWEMLPEEVTWGKKQAGFIRNYLTHIERIASSNNDLLAGMQQVWNYHFRKPLDGLLAFFRGEPYEYEIQMDAEGNIIRDKTGRPIYLRPGRGRFVEHRAGIMKDYELDVRRVLPAYVDSVARVIFRKPAAEEISEMIRQLPDEVPQARELAETKLRNYTRDDVYGEMASDRRSYPSPHVIDRWPTAGRLQRSYSGWRTECLKSGHSLDADVIAAKLGSALRRGDISAQEHGRAQEVLAEYLPPHEIDSETPPQVEDSDAHLLWRLGILVCAPEPRIWLIGWYVLYLLVIIAIGAIGRATDARAFFSPGADSGAYVGMMAALFAVRALYNRRYKGEWALDEAGAVLRPWSLLGVVVCPLQSQRYVAMFGVAAVLTLCLHLILWIFGRSPYKRFWYPWHFGG